MKTFRSPAPLLLAALVALAVALWWRSGTHRPEPALEPPPSPAPRLSDLAETPDWSQLDPWQESLTRDEFIRMMDEVFSVSDAWRDWFVVRDQSVEIQTNDPDHPYILRFSSSETSPSGPRYWRAASKLPAAPEGKPLQDVHIAIDPGHIGGRWARIEERWFQVGDGEPVREGSMTLLVAELLKPALEALGAKVSLVRSQTEPVTDYRPETLMDEAREKDPDSPRRLAERLFYRTAEIRARADKVNKQLEPDLVLCLHFNAEGWGDPLLPTLVPRTHFHLILNGAYTDSELALADQRFAITRKIAERIHPEEAALAESVAAAFVETTSLPPYLYEANSRRAVNIGGNPYLWARNLLANRLYDCPVVFLEPYVMNSTVDHERIQAGDYDGVKEVGGELRPSIFREYRDAVVKGLADYYRKHRLPSE